MPKPRYLTKSRFALAMECPTKLYYTGKEEYPDQSLDDPFMEALAEGGFQVGELARQYFPGGILIETLDYRQAEEETITYLERDSVILYEPAIRFNNFFIRADILVKQGSSLELIEVKAKSFMPGNGNPFFSTKGYLVNGWKSYIYDVAFQTWVIRQAMPDYSVGPFLMMADKSAKCPTDGLNQKFRIKRDERGRKYVVVSEDITPEDLSSRILIQVPVNDEVEHVLSGQEPDFQDTSFEKYITTLAQAYSEDSKILSPIGKHCGACQFRCSEEDENAGKRSGFKECWKSELGWNNRDFEDPTVLDLWFFRKKDQLIQNGKVKMSSITEEDIAPEPNGEPGLSTKERQWLQVQKSCSEDNSPYLDVEGMESEFAGWSFPLHFIDFETSMVAIPFNRGRRPYEAIAFQFSHHTVDQEGRAAHAGEYLCTTKGIFPNYEFIRSLKAELENDNGTIFRYGSHENTYLNKIYEQLQEDPEPPQDRDELCQFICSITHSTSNSQLPWTGERDMVDMHKLVKKYYYDPLTNGSNSIKYVLPAILNNSPYLQERYSKPIYGNPDFIPSHNYSNWIWIEKEGDRVKDPYHLLPPMFEDVSEEELELISQANETLRDGGAALTAYARMQFGEMSDYEREQIQKALLKYCELDTLAMVMIYEGWREMLKE